MPRTEYVSETRGDNPLMSLEVNGRIYNIRFALIVGSKRRVIMPVFRQGETRNIDFELLCGTGAVIMSQNYTHIETLKKRREPITNELVTTKRQVESLGWEAIVASLRRNGLGCKNLESVTVDDLIELAKQAITSNLFNSLGKNNVLVSICSSNLLERRAERNQKDKWVLYHPALIEPVGKSVYKIVKSKGYSYSEQEIGHLTEILDIGAG